VLVRASKRPASSGADERRRPAALTVSYLPQHAVTQERGVAFAHFCKGDDLLREPLFSLLSSSARLRIVQTSSSAVDIAWMSCGPNTLSLGNGTMVMGVLTARAGKNESGSFVPEPPRAHPQSPAMRCTTRPRPSSHHQRSCMRLLNRLASLNSVRIRTHALAIELVDEAEV
jgi:hypothetical protein